MLFIVYFCNDLRQYKIAYFRTQKTTKKRASKLLTRYDLVSKLFSGWGIEFGFVADRSVHYGNAVFVEVHFLYVKETSRAFAFGVGLFHTVVNAP